MLKNVKTILILMLVSLNVHALQTTVTTVPFSNIKLEPNDYIQAKYNFGAFSMIYCYENNLKSAGILAWPVGGQVGFSTLSNLPLVKNTSYQGNLADPVGTLGVTNNTSSSMIVSCLFVF